MESQRQSRRARKARRSDEKKGATSGQESQQVASQQVRPLKKRLIKVLSVVVFIVICLALGLSFLVNRLITEEFLTAKLEESINSKIEIGAVDVSIFSIPAKVTLSDVSLSPKGTSSTSASEVAPVQIKEADLRVGLLGLLRKHVDVSSITIREAEIQVTYYENGANSLEVLFESPDGKKDSDSGPDSDEEEEGGGFNVFDQEDFVATLGGLSIKNSKLTILLEEMGVRLQCLELNMDLSSIRIDPQKLAETNSAKLKIDSHVRIDSVKGWQYGDVYLSGESTTQVFNPVTGDVEPEVEGDFSLSEESWLNTRIPLITRSWKQLSVLEKVGIKIASLPERATFGRSKAIAAHYHLGKVSLKKPLSIWVGDWELAALDGSWLQTKTDEHEVNGELLASKKSSGYFKSLIEKGLDIFPEKVQEVVAQDVDKQLFRDGRLLIAVKSSGDFSDPKIRPVGAVVDFTEAAKKLLREKAGGLLNGLLGRDKEEDD